MKKQIIAVLSFLSCLGLSTCAGIPSDALQLRSESFQERQLQTRRFDTKDERKILVAGSQVLQDLGFTIEESETKLGVITASKDRDATDSVQVAFAILAALGGAPIPIDDRQKIRVSFITHLNNEKDIFARVTFQRIVWNTQGRVATSEAVADPKIYQEFFNKLSKSVFLTANEI